MAQVQFPRWPVWNFQFPTEDVKRIERVWYYDAGEQEMELPADQYRLAIGRSGVSALVLLRKGDLPAIADRPDAVTVEYEP